METITLAMVGSGGAGVVSLGELVLKTAAHQGYYGLMRKSFGPQIRGGESAAIIRLSDQPVGNFSGEINALFVLDWNNFSRFGDEIPITPQTTIIQDSKAGPVPEGISPDQVLTRDFTGAATSAGSSKANMAMLGFLGAWLNSDPQTIGPFISARLKKFDDEVRQVSLDAMENGFAIESVMSLPEPLSVAATSENWLATGNQLAGLGALEAGVRFVAAYPITPASDCLEWVANHIASVDGHLVQAEDELSAINMIIGAGFAGVPAMTATSGPGLALMSEAMGLAVASETPIVVLNVMRGGPSTGIPTKSEQSDLNIALFGLHGDAPHIVLSALSVGDCHSTMAWACHLSTTLQTLVIVLSDQFLGQSTQILPPMAQSPYRVAPKENNIDSENYERYRVTESGVSPMAVPGDIDCMYTADGLEHTENSVPSPKATDHQTQLDKRAQKLDDYDFGDDWADVHGEGDTVLLCWGSVSEAAQEARQQLLAEGISVKVIALRLLMPLPKEKLQSVCDGATNILVVEQNHQAQCAQYLMSLNLGLPFKSFAKPGPILITPQLIKDQLLMLSNPAINEGSY